MWLYFYFELLDVEDALIKAPNNQESFIEFQRDNSFGTLMSGKAAGKASQQPHTINPPIVDTANNKTKAPMIFKTDSIIKVLCDFYGINIDRASALEKNQSLPM